MQQSKRSKQVKKRYLYEQIVEEASGHQTYFVDAKSKEEADLIISEGGRKDGN